MQLSELTVRGFADLLGSDAPAPGGGSAAALAGALGAALTAMVGSLTVGKKKYAEFDGLARETLEKARDLEHRFLDVMQRDTEAFNAVSAVFAMPKGTDEEKTARSQAMQQALQGCTRTPFEMMELSLEALRLTGCKNTSRARKIGPEEVEALDWGMTFNVGREVPDNVAYLGIRASYFHVDNRAERGRNSYDLHVARVSDSRFERLVLLDVPRADAPTRLQWKVNKVGVPVDELPQAGETLRMHFDASKIHLVCR